MHGQYIRSRDGQLIDGEDTFVWLSMGDVKWEFESAIIAAQDQTLQTKYGATKILQTEAESKCRSYKQFGETAEHISARPVLAKDNK